MSSALFAGINFGLAGTIALPSSRGLCDNRCGVSFERALLPTDPIGSMSLSLQNVVVGSIYEVEVLTTGTQIAVGTASSSTVALSIPVYSAGNASNSLRIKVRKGSASPYYQPYETQATAAIGSQSIFVNQIIDE